jgi:HD-GYP domain-containing protein (c-di-GMP phosphodiesterase class II)
MEIPFSKPPVSTGPASPAPRPNQPAAAQTNVQQQAPVDAAIFSPNVAANVKIPQGLALAAQLSGVTWSWIKKIYPECDDSEEDAESCLFTALEDVAQPSFEHSNRVGQLANRFAQHLGLTQGQRKNLGKAIRFKECGLVGLQMHLWSEEEREEAVEVLLLGGAFHDIGKIAVSKDILEKPGRLTDEERKLMQLHPLIGEALLSRIPSAAPLLPAVRNHHERWDGLGYVDGLQGDEIPFEARVIAIVDSFDAMTESRPYRAAMTSEEACREVLAGLGSHFDPNLGAEFVAMLHGADFE